MTFQENPGQLARKAASFGWDLAPYIASGQLTISYVTESSLDLDIVASAVREKLAKGSLDRMAIDSLAEMVMAARESDRFPAFARSFLGSLRAAGTSVLTTSETSSLGPTTDSIGGLSFLYHKRRAASIFRVAVRGGPAIAILKMRNSGHEKWLRAFAISDSGFRVLGKLEGATGLLGWSALTGQEAQAGTPDRT